MKNAKNNIMDLMGQQSRRFEATKTFIGELYLC